MKSGTRSNLRRGVYFQIVPKFTSLVSYGTECFFIVPVEIQLSSASVLSLNMHLHLHFLFECQCIQHESANWGHYILRLQLETGPPFYVVIRATGRSRRLQCKGSTFISRLF